MKHGADAFILGRKYVYISSRERAHPQISLTRASSRQDKGEAAAKELSEATGRRCVFASVDVRKPDTLKAAAKKCIEIYGRIDFVICG